MQDAGGASASPVSPVDIVCVKHGKKYDARYVNILRDMVQRNLPAGLPGRFLCFTDDPTGVECETRPLPDGVSGWWAKLYLFDACRGPTLYFDLDTVIMGPLDEVVQIRPGFTILREFGMASGYGSGVMAWDGDYSHIWRDWLGAGKPILPRGDQEWVERCVPEVNYWQDLFPGRFKSFKFDKLWGGPPEDAWVVCFHGEPRPHNAGGWVAKVWSIGGGTSATLKFRPNVDEAQLIDHIQANRRHPRVQVQPAHDGVAAIVAGGPSLKASLPMLAALQPDVFACNGAGHFLLDRGIVPAYQVIVDARASNARFRVPGVRHLLGSQVHPSLFDGVDAQTFHCWMPGLESLVGEEITIAGGTTVGLKACVLAYVLGYREIHLFGFDSCYHDGDGHAYAQPENAGEDVLECEWGGRRFCAAPWMIRQAEEFPAVARQLIERGCQIAVHGEGWIPYMAKVMADGDAFTAERGEYAAWVMEQQAK